MPREGVIAAHAQSSQRHDIALNALSAVLTPSFQWSACGPGGWIFASQPELRLCGEVVFPDIAGWRHERPIAHLDRPYFTERPDWVCDVLCNATVQIDRCEKTWTYATAGIEHFWLIDPRIELLEAFQLDGKLWRLNGTFDYGAEVRAAPFDAVPLSLRLLSPFDAPSDTDEEL